MEKKEIIEGIHTLVSNNVIGEKQAGNRYKGFRGELFFEDYLTSRYPMYKQMEGGMIISRDSEESSLNNALYLSVIPQEQYNEDYLKIFSVLSRLNFQKMYLVLYTDNWNLQPVMSYYNGDISLKVPEMEIYEFNSQNSNFEKTSNKVSVVTDFFKTKQNRKKNLYPIPDSVRKELIENLKDFSSAQLTKIYVNRLFLDGYTGFGKEKGKPSDIDMILRAPCGAYRLIEVKEKDLPKQAKKGFGLDIPRLNDLLRIANETGLEYFLAVREINNQTERKLVAWKRINIKDFALNVRGNTSVTGGTGMRSETSVNETLICSYDLFRNL